jgi:CheY-like chemotaxis protein
MDIHFVEAFRQLRADPATRAIPVVAVTASEMAQERQKIMSAGFRIRREGRGAELDSSA